VKLYLNRTQPKPGKRTGAKQPSNQQWMTRANARAFVTSILRQGVFGRQRWSYWKFLMAVATKYRHCVGAAMTLAVMGYHLQVITQKLSEALDEVALPGIGEKRLPAEAGGEGK
jgi:hypothetical protein